MVTGLTDPTACSGAASPVSSSPTGPYSIRAPSRCGTRLSVDNRRQCDEHTHQDVCDCAEFEPHLRAVRAQCRADVEHLLQTRHRGQHLTHGDEHRTDQQHPRYYSHRRFYIVGCHFCCCRETPRRTRGGLKDAERLRRETVHPRRSCIRGRAQTTKHTVGVRTRPSRRWSVSVWSNDTGSVAQRSSAATSSATTSWSSGSRSMQS